MIAMKSILFLTLIVSTTAFGLGADSPAISGHWKVHNSIVNNESDQDCVLNQKDNEITGTCKSDQSSVDIKGTVEDKKVTWQYNSDYSGMQLTLEYTGTLTDSGRIEGSVTVQPIGITGTFTASQFK